MTGIIVPLYTYPTDGTWDRLIALRTAHPSVAVIAIINPNSGPGLVIDQNYVEGVKKLQAAAIQTLGYVATGWGSIPFVNAQSQADTYYRWYQVNGIFWDEFAAEAGQEGYYANLTQGVRGLMALSVGNPGTQASSTYFPLVDFLIQFEGDHLPDPRSTANYLSYNVKILPTNFPRPNWLYITDDTLPNPWDTLSSYLESLLIMLEGTPPAGKFTLTTPDGRSYSW